MSGILPRVLCATFLILGQSVKPVNADALQLVELADKNAEGAAKSAKWVMKKGGKWVKMKTQNDHLDKDGMWRQDVNDVTSVFSKKGQFILVTVSDSSPSGDWFDTSTYYFWPDKKLAKAEFSYLRIDWAGQRVTRWFDRRGKQVLREEKALSGTGEDSTNPEDVTRSKESRLGERRYPLTYSGLPFAKLVPL